MRKQWLLEHDWKFVKLDVLQGELLNCDTKDWDSVEVPHDWAISQPVHPDAVQGYSQGFFDRWGIGWYRYTFHLSEKAEEKKYLITFDAIYENSTVWINEEKVGGQKYGYTGFTLDITKQLTNGDNLIAVRVDNTAEPADRWYSGAGIYRKVILEECHPSSSRQLKDMI